MSTSSSQLERASRMPAAIPAWLLSFIVHTLVLTVGVLCYRVTPKGVEQPGRGVGIVLTQASASGATEYFSDDGESGASAAAATASAQAQGAQENSATESSPTIPLPGREQLPATGGPRLPTGLANVDTPGDESGIPGAGDFTAGGTGSGGSGGGGLNGKGSATLNVFGVQGTGSRFVFVFDRSLSMSGYQGRPLAASKRELLASLKSLGSINQFQIIFYNEEPKLFNTRPGQPPQLEFASDENKERAAAFISSITADGGTEHMEAIIKALAMTPDVIFFLTDADDPKLSDSDLNRIRSRNRSAAVINCIEYGSGASQSDNNFLKRLAAQNRGHHAYVDVTRLPTRK